MTTQSNNLAFVTDSLFEECPREAAINSLHAATALYTQDPVVTQLLDMISWPSGNGAVMDTSCGDGAFLGRALERLLTAFPGISDSDVCARLQGWEIHPQAAREARDRLRQILINHGRSYQMASGCAQEIVKTGDFLIEGPQRGSFQAIIGNPPYLRMPHVPDLLRNEYELILPEYAKADLLHSFLDRCVKLLARDGELAMVTADRWLFNEGAAELREVVGTHFGVSHIERLDSASTFYRPKQRRAGTPPRVHPVGVILKAHGLGVREIGRAPFYPEGENFVPEGTRTLGEIAEVKLAPWLGTVGIFVVDESVAAGWPEHATVPAIDTDDVKGGVLGTPYRRAILTYPDVEPAPAVMAHLDAQLERMCKRGRSKIRWMPPETFHRLDLSEPSLLVPRIAKTLKPVRVPAGVLPINHNLSIVRKGEFSLDEIEAALNHPKAHEWISLCAPRLENGYLSITTKLLRTLPMFAD